MLRRLWQFLISREVIVSLTEDDIRLGEATHPRRCPMARALRRALGEDLDIVVIGPYFWLGPLFFKVDLPRVAARWVNNFDSLHPSEPFRPLTFRLRVPR